MRIQIPVRWKEGVLPIEPWAFDERWDAVLRSGKETQQELMCVLHVQYIV